MLRKLLFLSGLLFVPVSGQARVFDIGNEHFAAYLKGQYGQAHQKDETFARSSGASTSFTDEYKVNYAYEFGFVYATPMVNLRFGFEILRPTDLKDVKGTSSGGTEYFGMTSSVSGYAPKIGLEANLKQWSQSRLFAAIDYGLATMTVQNSYTFTAAGQAQYPSAGATNFREELKGDGPLIETTLGFETLLSDATTIAFDVGYRALSVDSFKHTQAVTNFQGAVSEGTTALNDDGSTRTLNMNGAFASVMLRFWIK